jgi:hypothetical protein
MVPMPENYSLEYFSGLVGEKFLLHGLPIPDLEIILQQVVRHEITKNLDSFSLFFLGPDQPVLPQATYSTLNSTIGQLDIFLVPVARNADGVLYEAVFNLKRSE